MEYCRCVNEVLFLNDDIICKLRLIHVNKAASTAGGT